MSFTVSFAEPQNWPCYEFILLNDDDKTNLIFHRGCLLFLKSTSWGKVNQPKETQHCVGDMWGVHCVWYCNLPQYPLRWHAAARKPVRVPFPRNPELWSMTRWQGTRGGEQTCWSCVEHLATKLGVPIEIICLFPPSLTETVHERMSHPFCERTWQGENIKREAVRRCFDHKKMKLG